MVFQKADAIAEKDPVRWHYLIAGRWGLPTLSEHVKWAKLIVP